MQSHPLTPGERTRPVWRGRCRNALKVDMCFAAAGSRPSVVAGEQRGTGEWRLQNRENKRFDMNMHSTGTIRSTEINCIRIQAQTRPRVLQRRVARGRTELLLRYN